MMIAKQGADEKSQLENWKTDLLNKLTSQIAEIHKAHNIAMEAQREELENQRKQFQFEIQVLRERIREIELEKERMAQTQIRRAESVQKSPEREIAQNPMEEVTQPSQTPPPKTKQNRTYATVATAKPTETSTQPWTKVTYGNRKIEPTPATKTEPRRRRILFPRKSEGQPKSEANIMLALNEPLQKAGVESKVWFSRVRYARWLPTSRQGQSEISYISLGPLRHLLSQPSNKNIQTQIQTNSSNIADSNSQKRSAPLPLRLRIFNRGSLAKINQVSIKKIN